MQRTLLAFMVASSIAASAPDCLAAQPNTVSGRAVGEMTPSFPVLAVTGPHKGKSVCYICESNGAPLVLAFFRETGDETASLAGKLDDLAKDRNLRVVAVMIEGPDSRPWLEKFAEENRITIPLTVFRNGKHDVAMKLYKLNASVSNTILVSAKRNVTANFVDVKVQDFGRVTNAVSRVAGQK